MRIGELSHRTNTPRRLLRYYEEQELIVSQRAANGYRSYDERWVDRVLQIRELLAAGLPTRVIREILPYLGESRADQAGDASPEVIGSLEREHERMTERIQSLARNRDALADYLTMMRGHADSAAA